MLSPWFPPRYLWAAIEGAAGLDPAGGSPTVNPRLAPHWKWLGVRNLTLAGKAYSWFVVRAPELKMYANFRFRQELNYEMYDEDVTDGGRIDGDAAVSLALRRGNDLSVVIGNTLDRTIATSLRLLGDFARPYTAKSYKNLNARWMDIPHLKAAAVAKGIPIQVDRKGFCVLELRDGVA